jgi:hypothetical protein
MILLFTQKQYHSTLFFAPKVFVNFFLFSIYLSYPLSYSSPFDLKAQPSSIVTVHPLVPRLQRWNPMHYHAGAW